MAGRSVSVFRVNFQKHIRFARLITCALGKEDAFIRFEIMGEVNDAVADALRC